MIPQEFFDAAKRIVEEEKRLYPGCEGAQGSFDAGLTLAKSDYSTTGGRYGTANSQSWRDFNNNFLKGSTELGSDAPKAFVNAFASHVTPNRADTVRKDLAKAFLSTMLGKTDSQSPGYSQLTNFLDTSPTTFPGATQLSTTAARDPYSGSYELETENAYKQRASDAMAQAATGPEAVRGGASRTGIGQASLANLLAQGRGQEVRAAQAQEAGITRDAAGTYSAISNAIRQQVLNSSLGLAQAIGGQQERQLGAAKTVSSGQLLDVNMLNEIAKVLTHNADTRAENFASNEAGENDTSTWNITPM